MLIIDDLRMELPSAFAGRQNRIVQLVARELGRAPLEGDRRIGRLVVPPVEVRGGASDAEVAAGIAAAVRRELGRRP